MEKIDDLKKKKIDVPAWTDLALEYDPNQHEIMTDTVTRRDRVKKDGIDRASRITYGKQKLVVGQITQLAFTIPVMRIATPENEEQEKQLEAINAIYRKTRIDALNIKRFKAFFGACEMATIWYVEKKKNNDYGFESNLKLRCVSYSPMDTKFSRIEQAEIYPLFNEYGDMIALSFESKREENGIEVSYLESYTDTEKTVYKMEKGKWLEQTETTAVSIGKIPGVYIHRPLPIWEGTTNNIKEIEYTRSRQSDILRKNSAPVMKVVGTLINADDAPTSDQAREVYQLKEGGNIDYVKPPVDHLATKAHIDDLKETIDEELQIPNLSVENVKTFGASGVAREHLLTNAHLKIGEEQGDILEFLDRECNVIKAFLKLMNPAWANTIDDLEIEHKLTPFVMQDEAKEIDTLVKATGKSIMSQRTAITRAGYAKDVDDEIRQIREDDGLESQNDLFNPTF